MNIYVEKQIKCSICGKFIGEIDIGSSLIFPLCSTCNKKQKQIIHKGINKILVPVDITKKTTKALDVAIYLSKHLGASITLIQVIPNTQLGIVSFKNMFDEIRAKAEKVIKNAKNHCERKNVTVTHRIVHGDEGEMIVNIAKKSKFDLIIMGSSGKGILKEMIFGSVSNYVLHTSDVPVLMVKDKLNNLDTEITKPKSKKKLVKHSIKIPKRKSEQKFKRHENRIPLKKM